MASAVGGNLDYLETGPSKLTYKGVACGHTMGGITVSGKPLLRERKVDEHGENVVDVVHTGDNVEAKTTLVERTLQVVKTVYLFGAVVNSSTVGVGKSPGTTGRSLAGILLVHPLAAGASTGKDVKFHKAIVSDNGEVQVGTVNSDVVFQVTFRALYDDTQTDGQRYYTIGTIPAT